MRTPEEIRARINDLAKIDPEIDHHTATIQRQTLLWVLEKSSTKKEKEHGKS